MADDALIGEIALAVVVVLGKHPIMTAPEVQSAPDFAFRGAGELKHAGIVGIARLSAPIEQDPGFTAHMALRHLDGISGVDEAPMAALAVEVAVQQAQHGRVPSILDVPAALGSALAGGV